MASQPTALTARKGAARHNCGEGTLRGGSGHPNSLDSSIQMVPGQPRSLPGSCETTTPPSLGRPLRLEWMPACTPGAPLRVPACLALRAVGPSPFQWEGGPEGDPSAALQLQLQRSRSWNPPKAAHDSGGAGTAPKSSSCSCSHPRAPQHLCQPRIGAHAQQTGSLGLE